MSDFSRPSLESARSENDRPLPPQGLRDNTARHPRGGGPACGGITRDRSEDPASFENAPSATPTEVGVQRTSEILGEAIMDSVSSVRDSLPEQHREHFKTLRQEIIDFAQAHGIPRESLNKPDALREAASKLSTPDLQRLATLLERFEYLLVHHELMKEEIDPAKALEYAEEHYHLKEQYDFQVNLLGEVGILKEGAILGIDGNKYPIPTLEQIAIRLFERREDLKTKHDQGFTKLLLVPFGMSLYSLREILKQFLLGHKSTHKRCRPNENEPLWAAREYQGADTGDSPRLVYHPKFFDKDAHQGETKAQILAKHADDQDPFAGWTVHLFQPSNPKDQDSLGFAHIPGNRQGAEYGNEIPRKDIETSKVSEKYLSALQEAQSDPSSPYHLESGMTPEDWIMAFIIHLTETGRPLDDWQADTENASSLIGAFFSSDVKVPRVYWDYDRHQINFGFNGPTVLATYMGARYSVIV